MKRIVLLLMMTGMMISTSVNAQEAMEIIFADGNPIEYPGPKRTPIQLPRVYYDAQNLYVWSAVTIDMLQVIIRDEDDNIIYNNVCMPLLPGSTTLILPSTVCTDKYSIELLFGDCHLIGYFWVLY